MKLVALNLALYAFHKTKEKKQDLPIWTFVFLCTESDNFMCIFILFFMRVLFIIILKLSNSWIEKSLQWYCPQKVDWKSITYTRNRAFRLSLVLRNSGFLTKQWVRSLKIPRYTRKILLRNITNISSSEVQFPSIQRLLVWRMVLLVYPSR